MWDKCKIMKIAIINYGVGNIKSIKSAILKLGHEAVCSANPAELLECNGLILPGVGAFGPAMEKLTSTGLDKVVKTFHENNKPILGICLGMQLLFDSSEEFGHHDGLKLIKGKVINMRALIKDQDRLPHVGWANIKINMNNFNTILNNLDGNDVYFIHSFYCQPDDENLIMSKTVYSGLSFCSSVSSANIFGCQFHPEKSGLIGLEILDNFCKKVEIELIGE